MARVIRAAAVQAEPRWLDIEQGVDQVVDYIGQAASGGARIVSFPEVFIPGYPWWIWLDAPAWGMQFVSRYIQNSMTRDGEHMTRIAKAAAANNIFVVLGFSQRSGSTVYVSQAIIDASGEIVAVRRKLKPTHVERSVFGEGDGSDIAVHDTDLGRIGALNCAENIQPLTKFAMFSMGEQIHVASWPSFSLYRGVAQALSAEVNNAASLTYAVEGQTFVLAPCAVVGRAGQDLFCDTDLKRQLLQCGGGFAQIYGPEGSTLTPPLAEAEEGILFADLDFDMIDVAKHAFDPVGHYSRPDVFQLLFNPRKNEVVGAFDKTDPLVRRSVTDSAPPVATDDGESD